MNRQRTAALRAVLALSSAWMLFYFWRPATFVLTSFGSWPPAAPLFAFLVPAATVWVLLAVGVVAAGAWLTQRIDRFRSLVFLALAFGFAAALSLSVHAIRLGILPGPELMLFRGEEILEDARAADSVPALLRTYTDRQPTLSLHGRTKPPGFAVMYRAMLAVLPDSLPVIATLLTLLASLAVVPVYALARLLDGDEKRARGAALVAAAAPSAVMFGAVSLDAVFATVAALALMLTAWELSGPSAAKRATVGFAIFIMLMLSYSGFVVGLVCALWLALERARQPSALFRSALEVAAGAVVPLLVLKLVSGFDAWTCFLNAVHLNAEFMSRVVGKSLTSPAVWSYASIGNAVAFAIGLGPAVVGSLALIRRSDLPGLAWTLTCSAAAALVVACVAGIYLMETERIFLFFLPIAAVLAVRPRDVTARFTVTVSAATALVFEMALLTFW